MKIEIKLEDAESCEGCPFLIHTYSTEEKRKSLLRWYCVAATRYRYSLKRPKRCIKENEL